MKDVQRRACRFPDALLQIRARGHLLGSNAADTRLGVLFHASSSEWDELHLEASDLHVGSARQCQKHAYTYWPAPGTAAFEIRAMKVLIPNTPSNSISRSLIPHSIRSRRVHNIF